MDIVLGSMAFMLNKHNLEIPEGHRSVSGDDGCLAGRLTGAQAKSPKPGAAGAAESCCAE